MVMKNSIFWKFQDTSDGLWLNEKYQLLHMTWDFHDGADLYSRVPGSTVLSGRWALNDSDENAASILGNPEDRISERVVSKMVNLKTEAACTFETLLPTHHTTLHHLLVYWFLFLLSISKLVFNLLKSTGYVMHQQFNIQQLYALPTL